MMGRRLLLLVVVLMGLTALAASVAPRDSGRSGPTIVPGRPGALEPTATPSPTATPTPAVEEDVQEETLSAERGASPTTLRARLGRILRLRVQGEVFDEVVLDGLDRVEPITPEAPAQFELYVDRTGRFPIRLQEASRTLGEIVVSG